ncbi:MAG: hypothetical protein V1904_07030 [Bacteroidota bacterium]
MKRFHLIFIILMFFCFQKNQQAQNAVLIKNIEYDVPIINKELCQGSELSETDWWKRNIETSKRWYFQQALLNKALNGQIKVYDENEKELNIAAVTKLVSFSDTVRLARSKPPYGFYDTVYTKYISPSEIHSIRFRETWYYDTITYKITKEITQYSPLITLDKAIKVQNKTKYVTQDIPLFWIKTNPNEDKKDYITLTGYILYNCPIYYNMPVAMPQFGNLVNISTDTMSRKIYTWDLMFAAISNNIKAYLSTDINDYYVYVIDSMAAFSKLEILELAAKCDTIRMERATPPHEFADSVICTVKDIDGLTMLRFHEKWLLNPNTMELQKEVIALSPCEEVKSVDGSFKGIRPLFTVFFENAVRCFKESFFIDD